MPSRFPFTHPAGRVVALALLVALMLAGAGLALTQSARSADACVSPNAIVCENQLPGTPQDQWDVDGSGDPTIQGFATDISVDQGQQIDFKIKTDATAYSIDIYRLGWYGGDGARKVATIQPSASLPQTQPTCLHDGATDMADCGNWSVSASWNVPADATSGVYFARPQRADTGGASQIPFIVRSDSSHSDLLVQTSDETWQAYNHYGGNSLYGPANGSTTAFHSEGYPDTRAYAVSYNRPFDTRDTEPHSYLFGEEYPMIRWLEQNGYDISYFTDVDTARRPQQILQHKVFVTSGHDEYWSADQRSNVDSAIKAGVNMAFFSGDSMTWKTRLSSSIDPSSTPYRTVTTYKETAAGKRIDPNPNSWTGTWSDPLGGPPLDAYKPENSLQGTSFSVGPDRDDAIEVPAADGKMRFWRGTSVSTLPSTGKATLPLGTLGYEWDDTPDNGFQPAGRFNLSTTTLDVSSKLLDAGTTFGQGTATHHLSLYRAPSGALVFGAGTVQWAWGLDDRHDGGGPDPDPRMQQATVNLFADMGVQPASIQTGLAKATQSTDHTAPTSAITSPASGTNAPRGSKVTISGTAQDTGGQVAGVEVSTDGGSTWHSATGRASWSYTWKASGMGTVKVKSRAVDDSGNLETPGAGIDIAVGDCPCSIWDDQTTPQTDSSTDGNAYEVGMKFKSDIAGYVTGVRFYKGVDNTGAHIGRLWASNGRRLASVTFSNETASGWQQASFSSPVAINANATYVISYTAPNGHFSMDRPYFVNNGVGTAPYDNAPLHALRDGVNGPNGVYGPAGEYPTTAVTGTGTNYWVDPVFVRTSPDSTPPTIDEVTPSAASTRVPASEDVTASFSEALNPDTVTGSNFKLTDAQGNAIPATVSYDASNLRAVLTPSSPLANGASYTAKIIGGSNGITDLAGNALVKDYTWTFKTYVPGTCPCTLWDDSAIPSTLAVNDNQPLELGLRFTADRSGYIRGVRFYKGPGNDGTHVGHLWTADGIQLASATFGNETSSGWQEADFGTPVAVTANTTYVISYSNPHGNFSVDRPFFNTGGSTPTPKPFDNAPLHAPGDTPLTTNGVTLGGQGLAGGAGSFPTRTFTGSNYWVDPVFDDSGRDTQPPTVLTYTPANNAAGQDTSTAPTVLFSENMDASSITASGALTLRTAGGTTVTTSVTYDANNRTATVTPAAPLALATTYTLTVKGGSGGVKDASGNALASDDSSSFTTANPPSCPCSIFSSAVAPDTPSSPDQGAYELGVRFRSDISGFITGIRFYKGTGNTGTHVGRLWTNNGLQLAAATFTSESASGWQSVSFPSPVPVNAGTTYVASYTDPNGGFAVTHPYFTSAVDSGTLHALADSPSSGNGVYAGPGQFPSNTYDASNYFVDVTFTQSDTTPPSVTDRTPTAGATGASLSAPLTATFNKAVDPSTVTSSTFTLQPTGGNAVPATVSYDQVSHKATLTPSAALTPSTAYTVRIKGGASGVKDLSGNTMPSDDTSTFTSFGPSSCPCTLFSAGTTPGTTDSGDPNGYELGMRFTSDVSGYISGVRFYKSAANTGTHTGSLWQADGTRLARVTFSGESASGWQQASFASPVPVTAGVAYVVSYTDPNGHFAMDRPVFDKPPSNYPLAATQDASGAPNGVFGPPGSFPQGTYSSTNYYVDPVFVVNDTTAPAVTTRTPSAGATGVPTGGTVTATFNKPMTASSINGTTVTLAPPSGTPVAASVSYDSVQRTVTLTPSSALAGATTYTARVKGGASGVKDANGNAMPSDDTWTFTTFDSASCPCSLWSTATTPGTIDSGDANAYELGVRVKPSVAGTITGIRFYKSAANTGTHAVSLWAPDGTRLATATATNETASGWQQVDFAQPVTVQAGTTYVASYTDPNGHFSVDHPYFDPTFGHGAVSNYPLTAPADGDPLAPVGQASNGLYGAPGTLPGNSYDSSNYWVDVLFRPAS